MILDSKGPYRASFFALLIATLFPYLICLIGYYALSSSFKHLTMQLVFGSFFLLVFLSPSQIATYFLIYNGWARNFWVLQIFTIVTVGLNCMPAIGFSSPRAKAEMSYYPFFIFCFLHNVIYHFLMVPPDTSKEAIYAEVLSRLTPEQIAALTAQQREEIEKQLTGAVTGKPEEEKTL